MPTPHTHLQARSAALNGGALAHPGIRLAAGAWMPGGLAPARGVVNCSIYTCKLFLNVSLTFGSFPSSAKGARSTRSRSGLGSASKLEGEIGGEMEHEKACFGRWPLYFPKSFYKNGAYFLSTSFFCTALFLQGIISFFFLEVRKVKKRKISNRSGV